MSFLGEIFDCIQNFHEKSYPAPISLHTYLNIVSSTFNGTIVPVLFGGGMGIQNMV